MVLQCLSQINGVETLEGNIINNWLGDGVDGVKGIHVTQDEKNHAVGVRVEINVAYGVSIPEKAEEVQTKILQEISRLTGLHVGSVHVIFKNLISPKPDLEQILEKRLPT